MAVRIGIFLLLGLLPCLAFPARAQVAHTVQEGFERATFAAAFVPCERPEGAISLSQDRARAGSQALKLRIREPVFGTATWVPKATSCLIAGRYAEYTPDEKERAEIWESFEFGPRFGDDLYYGFSMWIDRASAPKGDNTRLVIGQWKAPIDDSPFVAQRFTGGLYHVTLDVDAAQSDPDTGRPYGCKLLLAFEADMADATLATPARCEPKFGGPLMSLTPARPIAIERLAYLPTPFGQWTDLVFRVKGGENGAVEVWANGNKIARAVGFIGHHGATGQPQYFKFGPYRDPAAYATTVYLDNLARGASFAAVDPASPLFQQ
ncbi:MAG: heparin lyase I family protein [Rhodospirillaceae bacterium]|nr:heparin lyase I family protein [Rhodospirillaceae bacterium]